MMVFNDRSLDPELHVFTFLNTNSGVAYFFFFFFFFLYSSRVLLLFQVKVKHHYTADNHIIIGNHVTCIG